MIQCPKCQFEQPEDIYCAQCGINMKTYVAPKRSAALDLMKNQVFQVGVLFVAIIIFVLYDYSLSKKPVPPARATVAKESSQPLDIPDANAPETDSPRPSRPSAETQAVRLQQDSERSEMAAPATALPSRAVKKNAPLGKLQENQAMVPSAPVVKNALQISFYQVSRNLLAELQRDASSSQITGDGFGGILPKKRLNILKRSGEMRSVSVNRYKLDGHPISIFKGQRSGENPKSIGIYFQINPLKNDASATQIELKSWGSLKLQEGDENFFSSEMTLNTQYSAFVSGFLPKDKTFSDEEKSIFESDRALKIYNQDDFWDGNTDLILLVELPD